MQIPKLLFSASILANLALASPLAGRQDNKLRIMPLGDSITEITCWRALVWDMIAEANYTDYVEYVGSQDSNPENCVPKTPNWDQHHEGHSGWLAIDIANDYLEGWLESTPADIVMFHLGTNDIGQGHSTDEIIDAFTNLVEIMRAANSNMKIIVDQIIPIASDSDDVDDLNAQIPGWAQGLNSTDSPIVIADCNTGFPLSDLRDGLHPNAEGDEVMASRIGPLLLDYIGESLAV